MVFSAATDTDALLVLALAGGPLRPLRRLLAPGQRPAAALSGGASRWRQAGCNGDQCRALAAPDGAALERTRRWLQHPHHHLLGWHDADYPVLLRHGPNPPPVLFIDGDPSHLWRPAIAIVGSRNPSAGGRDTTARFANELAAAGITVASGLATGIDAAAHQASLAAKGSTFAVIGTGPDINYPRHHRSLQEQIATHGAVISEYPPGTPPRSGQFPARNRLLAGLTLATLVIEAAQRSGALITARLAAEAGREVFAVPGSIHNPMARGCHRLIREGATLATCVEDILLELGPLGEVLANALQKRQPASIEDGPEALLPAPPPPDPDYQCLWQALGHDPTGMDSLIERTGLTAARLSSMLLVMELEGKVTSAHGRYTRT